MTVWVHNVKRTHYEIILSTLLPHPPDFAKVGGHWEKLSSRTEQMKEGEDEIKMQMNIFRKFYFKPEIFLIIQKPVFLFLSCECR